MGKLFKINDPKVLAIPVVDNQEPLIDISKLYPDLFYDKSREGVFKYNEPVCKLRKNVVERLLVAQRYLPSGLVIKIKEGYRPLAVQKKIYQKHFQDLKKRYPGKTQKFYLSKASEYVAPPNNIPPHTTGGVVDLTLMTIRNMELDMGQRINANSKDTVTKTKNISAYARKNRKILIKAMTSAGFVNYPFEWWHWSYGDRYWAYVKGRHSIYGSK